MIHLWRGFHHDDLFRLLKDSWASEELVLLVPNHLRDFSFIKICKAENLQFRGSWPDNMKKSMIAQASGTSAVQDGGLLQHAVLGVFTSGTTSGIHRLVLYSRENILASLESIRSLYDTEKIKKIFSYPPPTHTFGLVLGYMQAVIYDLELWYLPGPYSTATHAAWIENVDANTLTLGTPTHFIDLLEWVRERKQTATPSYSAIVGGACATKDLWKQLRSSLNISMPSVGYGATEASPGVTHLPPGVEPDEDGDIGYALPGVRIGAHESLGIEFSGQNVCLAILEDGELRAQSKIHLKDHLHAHPSPKGDRYTFVGRADSLINRGGAKFSLEAIEAKIASEFGCRTLAIAIYDARLGEDVAVLMSEPHDVRELLQKEFGLKLQAKNILISEIPLNANGKYDRKEALKLLLRSKELKLPIAVEHLLGFLPHRGSAIWVDRLLETKKHFGVAEVIIDEGKNYYSAEGFRNTACIEWVAQTYGYAVAMNEILQLQSEKSAPRVFIVEVKSCDFTLDEYTLRRGDIVHVEVQCTHDFGVLKVVDGKVRFGEKTLARMSLKLYCGQ